MCKFSYRLIFRKGRVFKWQRMWREKSQSFFLTKGKWKTDYISNNGKRTVVEINSFKAIMKSFLTAWPNSQKSMYRIFNLPNLIFLILKFSAICTIWDFSSNWIVNNLFFLGSILRNVQLCFINLQLQQKELEHSERGYCQGPKKCQQTKQPRVMIPVIWWVKGRENKFEGHIFRILLSFWKVEHFWILNVLTWILQKSLKDDKR